jgi:hypothetical protein
MDYRTNAIKENLEKSGIPSDFAVLMALAALKKPVNPEFLDSLRDENATLAEEVANWGNGNYDISAQGREISTPTERLVNDILDESNHSAQEIIPVVAIQQ